MGRVSTVRQDADAVTRRIRFELGRELRNARLEAGASLRAVGARAGMSHSQLGRIERGELALLTIEQASRACSAAGLELVVRAFAGGGPVVDAAQLALLRRLRALLPDGVTMRTEVPIPIVGDRRAWDSVVTLQPRPVPFEAETRLRDIQALDRRTALKLRDSDFDRVVLVVSDTRHNRTVLDERREELRTSFPLDTRAVLRAVRAGLTPEASGIAVL